MTVEPLPLPDYLLVQVRHRPAWKYLDGVREFARFYCDTTFDSELAQRIQVVVQELLENAVKYSSRPEGHIELSISSTDNEIRIGVSNPVDPESLAVLVSELAFVQSFSPQECYVAAVRRAADFPAQASRLGLARIRHEGGCELSCEARLGLVRVTATSPLR